MTTTELKDLLGFGASLAQLADALKGGLNLGELPLFIGVAQKVPTVVSEAPNALQEYLSLDDAGRTDVDAYVVNTFTLGEKKPQEIVQAAIKLVVDFTKIVQDGEALAAAIKS